MVCTIHPPCGGFLGGFYMVLVLAGGRVA